MPEGQQRDMRQGFLVDVFSLRPQIFHDVVDLDRIPIQDRIGNQAQALPRNSVESELH
jgi:hypothetical protein